MNKSINSFQHQTRTISMVQCSVSPYWSIPIALDHLDQWLLQACNQKIFSERHTNLHLTIAEKVRNMWTSYTVSIDFLNFLALTSLWRLLESDSGKTTKETFLIKKRGQELTTFSADKIVGMEEVSYRACKLKMIEWNWVVDWIRANEGERTSPRILWLESRADGTYKQENFCGAGINHPFLSYPFCLISCTCLCSSFSHTTMHAIAFYFSE